MTKYIITLILLLRISIASEYYSTIWGNCNIQNSEYSINNKKLKQIIGAKIEKLSKLFGPIDKKDFTIETKKFMQLHDYVIRKKHKIYLCKDFLFNKKKICSNYPNFKNFLKVKKKYDKNNLLSSDFLKRIS